MKVLITILIGLLVAGCGGNGENSPSAPSISIHEAAENGDLEAINKHIAAGTNINSTNGKDGETPLHRAITRGQAEAAKLLIEKGCDINIGRTRDGDTPLDMAEGRKRTEIAKLLREKGAKKSSN
jgi:ankyrin repeat protein